MPTGKTPTYKIIQTKFKISRKQMRDIWESHNLVGFYMPLLHQRIKDEEIEVLRLQALLVPNEKRYSKKDTFGAIHHLLTKANPRRTLIDAVSTFEDFLSQLVYYVYRDYPGRLLSGDQDSNLSLAQFTKLLKLIVNSSDKEEMLSKLVEEKIRGIFYGNPVAFFAKDKAKLDFGDFFRSNCKDELEKYQELIARRNALVHNGGRVDRKYLREVRGSAFTLGQMIPISTAYLRDSIALLEGLGAVAATLVLRNIYKQEPRSTLARSWKSFLLHTKSQR